MTEAWSFSMGRVRLHRGVERPRAVVCLPADEETVRLLLPLLRPGIALAAIDGTDWDRDFSPWPAPGVFRDGDFAGGGPALLRALEEEVVPAVDAACPGAPRVLAGYSLAGLFAVWASMQTDIFAGVAAMSGSLWYDGFLAYAASTPCRAARVYLSVGDREKRTRNPRMQGVEDAIRTVQGLLTAQGVQTSFELEPGNHFQNVPERISRGINWVCEAFPQR